MKDLTLQLIDQVSQAYQQRTPLMIQGNNSKAFAGRTPLKNKTKDNVSTLSTAAHTGIINYQPVELVMTARAGTTLAELRAALDEHQQILAFEAPDFDGQATIAGTLATNLSGPARPWTGSVRDMVLGTRLINGTGEHLRFGGQVMKNVAGYDVSRMQAGALGTLGVITEISFKVLPRPEYSTGLTLELPASEAIVLMNQLAGQANPITGACWYRDQLHIRLSGAARAVDKTVTSWSLKYGFQQADQGHFWQQLQHQQLPVFTETGALWRFSVNSTADDLAPAVHQTGIEVSDSLIDWCGSQRWLRTPETLAEQQNTRLQSLQRLAENARGSVTLWRGGDRSQEINQTLPPVLERLHKNVKQAMDPAGILNPGRLYSWM